MFEGSVVVLAVRIVVGLEEVVRFPRLLTDWRQTRKKSAPSGGGLADSLSSLSGPEAGGSTRSIGLEIERELKINAAIRKKCSRRSRPPGQWIFRRAAIPRRRPVGTDSHC